MSASDSKVCRHPGVCLISLRGLQLLELLQGLGRVGSVAKLLVGQPQLIVGFEMLWIEFRGFRQVGNSLRHSAPQPQPAFLAGNGHPPVAVQETEPAGIRLRPDQTVAASADSRLACSERAHLPAPGLTRGRKRTPCFLKLALAGIQLPKRQRYFCGVGFQLQCLLETALRLSRIA